MKNYRMLFGCLFICVIVLALLVGCRKKIPDQTYVTDDVTSNVTGDVAGELSSDIPTYTTALNADIESVTGAFIDPAFTPSDGIDENGFWEGIKAIDYVEMFDYKTTQISEELLNVSEDSVEQAIDNFLNNYQDREEIMDRAVEEGDLVNIDYVGSVNGFELENLSTEGMGTEVIAGSTDYIDDFLTQIIGHKPGETFNIEVTYPEDFGKDVLNGKDAVFVTTINCIIVESVPELNDDFVVKNLSGLYGWKTVEEMNKGITNGLRSQAIHDAVFEFLTTSVLVKAIPKKMVDYQVQSMFLHYQSEAENVGMTLEEYTLKSPSELAYNNLADINARAIYYLVNQAIAEDVGLSVSEADLKAFAVENIGSEDYSIMVAQSGLPFIKQAVLCQKVAEYIVDNAELM